VRRIRGLIPAVLVGGIFALYLVNVLGAGWPFAIGSSVVLGGAIAAVVLTRTTEQDVMADEAWIAAAPDLPPSSDRRAMEASQGTLPGPEKGRTARDRATRSKAKDGIAR